MRTEFANRISEMRRQRGIPQRVAAAELGVSQALLSHYENGVREPKLAFLPQIAEYYGVSVDFLLCPPANDTCDSAERAKRIVARMLAAAQELGGQTLAAACAEYISLAAQNAGIISANPYAPYDPSRVVELRVAEGGIYEKARSTSGGGTDNK